MTTDLSLIADLTKHPGFAAWRDAVNANTEKKTLELARELLFADHVFNEVDLAYRRGYLKGRLDVVRQPEAAAKKTDKE